MMTAEEIAAVRETLASGDVGDLKIYQFYHNDFGEDVVRAVGATSASGAVDVFVKNYCGVHTDELVAHRRVEADMLITAEDVNGQHVQIEWLIQEIELGEGVLF